MSYLREQFGAFPAELCDDPQIDVLVRTVNGLRADLRSFEGCSVALRSILEGNVLREFTAVQCEATDEVGRVLAEMERLKIGMKVLLHDEDVPDSDIAALRADWEKEAAIGVISSDLLARVVATRARFSLHSPAGKSPLSLHELFKRRHFSRTETALSDDGWPHSHDGGSSGE